MFGGRGCGRRWLKGGGGGEDGLSHSSTSPIQVPRRLG